MNYVRKLVTQDLGFGQQIEDALKKIQLQKEMQEKEAEMWSDDEDNTLTDEDYTEYFAEVEAQKEQDRNNAGEEG